MNSCYSPGIRVGLRQWRSLPMARCLPPVQAQHIVGRSICGTLRQEKISPPLGGITAPGSNLSGLWHSPLMAQHLLLDPTGRSICGTLRQKQISLPLKGNRSGSLLLHFHPMAQRSLQGSVMTRSSYGILLQEQILLPLDILILSSLLHFLPMVQHSLQGLGMSDCGMLRPGQMSQR